ncbi:Small ubiquitin-related modifier 1 [Bienertia sinuspersici]
MKKMNDINSESSNSQDNQSNKKQEKSDPNYIFLRFINQKNEVTHFKVRRTAKIENAFRTYCKHHQLQFGTARFFLFGDHIPKHLTPDELQLSLKDGVEIEVYSEVNGGNYGPIAS